jgi:hypothetical protein
MNCLKKRGSLSLGTKHVTFLWTDIYFLWTDIYFLWTDIYFLWTDIYFPLYNKLEQRLQP